MKTLAEHAASLSAPVILLVLPNGHEQRVALMSDALCPFAPDRFSGGPCDDRDCNPQTWHWDGQPVKSGKRLLWPTTYSGERAEAVLCVLDPETWREQLRNMAAWSEATGKWVADPAHIKKDPLETLENFIGVGSKRKTEWINRETFNRNFKNNERACLCGASLRGNVKHDFGCPAERR